MSLVYCEGKQVYTVIKTNMLHFFKHDYYSYNYVYRSRKPTYMPLNSFSRWAHPIYYWKFCLEFFFTKWNQCRGRPSIFIRI